jgi:Calcineurin-like phosphoesterase
MKLSQFRLHLLSATVLFLSSPLYAGPGAARDWKGCPAIVEIDTAHDIYAIGDVHGDYERLVTLLLAHKLIAEDPPEPRKVRWAAGKATLVCTGDMIDKGEHGLHVIALFNAMKEQAEKAGGRVVVCAGNHEAEFLATQGQSKKAVDFVKELQKAKLDPVAVAEGRDQAGVGVFLRSLPFACRVNDWFFVHAGETQGKTLPVLREAFMKDVDANGYKANCLLGDNSPLQARLNPHPWWERPGEKASDGRERLASQLAALGVRHLVIGHQHAGVEFADGTSRKRGQMIQKFDGLIFLIDVGMSRMIADSTGALLHVHPDGKRVTAEALFPDGSAMPLWHSP